MQSESLQFLKSLVDTPSPSGYETAAQKVFRDYVSPFADEVVTDVLGNVIACKGFDRRPRVMVTGHCDQIGFIVTHIDDDGFVYFKRIGGLDPAVCVSQRVLIQGRDEQVYGVVGRKAIHLQEPDERDKPAKLDAMWVDIGAKDKADAQARVRLGDPGVFVQDFRELPNNRAVSMAFDNKMAVWIVAEVMKQWKGSNAGLFGVSTVQEEIGSIGASASAFRVEPDAAIVIDVGHATDYPGMDKKKGDYALDKGPILSRGANINPKMFDLLVSAAEAAGLPYQTEGIGGRSATDADPIQYSRQGVAVGLIHVPLRYMHSPCEIISLADMETTVKLICGFLDLLTADTSFIPGGDG